MGGICKVSRLDGFSCHDMLTKFREEWFRHSEYGEEAMFTNALTA
jgi:hypothetical protein